MTQESKYCVVGFLGEKICWVNNAGNQINNKQINLVTPILDMVESNKPFSGTNNLLKINVHFYLIC